MIGTPTQGQLTTLKTSINSDMSALAANPTDGNLSQICATMNADAAGPVKVWRSFVSADEYVPVFAGNPTEVQALTVAQSRVWEYLTGMNTRTVNPSNSAFRTAVTSAFSVAAPNTLTALTALAKRNASRFEHLYDVQASGTGTMALEGPLTRDDVMNALNRG